MGDEAQEKRRMAPRGAIVNGARLRELRVSHAWTQAELAQRAKVSRPTVTRGESGHRINLTAIRKLAKVLQVSHKDLMAGADPDDEDEHTSAA